MNLTHWLRARLGRPSISAIRRRPRFTGALTRLEDRTVPSGVRTIDGTGNNTAHPDWGSDGVDFLRRAPSAYANGISTPSGAGRPSARTISNTIAAHPANPIENNRSLSAFVY